MKTLQKLMLILFTILLFSCKNSVEAVYNDFSKETKTQTADTSKKAYIIFNLIESNSSAVQSRSISSGVTAGLFSNITFSGTRSDGTTLTPVTASSFTQLSGQSIEVEPGNWNFNLEAWLGKTSTQPGEKYTATQSLSVGAGNNELKMSLSPDSASTATPASHPGSWQVEVTFPCNSENLIDKVEVWLFNYSDFSTAGANLSSVTKQYEHTYVKGTDFSASGTQAITAGETSRACGNYIVYVRFFKNVVQQGGTSDTATVTQTELINTWGEFMSINPGAAANGTISLPNADTVYKIQYDLGGAQWDSTSTENIPVSYTRNSGTSGVITLPTDPAFVYRGAFYRFEGWYTDPDFATGTGPVTTFNVSEARDKIFYAKWHEPTYDVYISCEGNDANEGTRAHPVKNATAAYSKFDDLIATNADGSIKNTIHILTDYTGTNKIATPWGDGSKNGMLVKFAGEKNGNENTDVTLELDMSNCGTPQGPQSFIYIENSQKMKFSHINITSNQTHENPNGYACLSTVSGTELIFEDSSIKGYVANGCAGINVEGVAKFKNCEISGNKAIDANTDPTTVWGCAVNVSSGELHLEGKVVIKNNSILKADGSGSLEAEAYNLYAGTYNGADLVLNPIVIDGAITNSEIWVKLAHEPHAFTTNYAIHETAIPATYFHSDSGFEVISNSISHEAEISKTFVVYVNSSSATPAGNDTNGDGTISKPYLTIDKAIQKITSMNDTDIDATICVTGDVPCNVIIDDGSAGTELVAKSLTIQGTGTAAGGDWKTAAAASALNGDTNGDGTGDNSIIVMRAQVPLSIKNLTLKNGKSTASGGALYYNGTKPVLIDSCLVYNNIAADCGGAFYFSNSNVSLSYTEIHDNKVTSTATDCGEGGALYLCGGNLAYASSVSFKANFAPRYGGAIAAINSETKNAVVTMNGGTIEANGALLQGGGVYIGKNASFTMAAGADSVIKNNGIFGYRPSPSTPQTRTAGGGVAVAKGGTFTMNDGEISGNLAQSGAAIYVFGTATLNDGTITSNKKAYNNEVEYDFTTLTTSELTEILASGLEHYFSAANVEIGIPGIFEMKGGTITQSSDMTAKGRNGVGVNLYAVTGTGDKVGDGDATFNMSGGSITGFTMGENGNGVVSLNVAVSGSKAIFNMSGGSIKNNNYIGNTSSSSLGGAIYISDNGYFTMTGGEISANHARTNGGAIYMTGSNSDITLGKSGSTSKIIIKDNTAGSENTINNIWLNSTTAKINIAGPLSSESEIGIDRTGSVSTTPFTNGYATTNNGTDPALIFTSDKGYSVITDASGEAIFVDSSVNTSVYYPDDYVITLTADKSQVTKGTATVVTVTPTVTRKEANGTETTLYYNPADHKLYTDSSFTTLAAGNNTVTLEAMLLCGGVVEYPVLSAGTGADSNKFTIPALAWEDIYTLSVTATYMGLARDTSFTVQCVMGD